MRAPAVKKRQDTYYRSRYKELISRYLLEPAIAVATAFDARRTLRDREMYQAIAGEPVGLSPPAHVQHTCTALQELGYIWQAPDRLDWEPGIPSLMDYVCDQSAITPEPRPDTAGSRVTRQ